MFCKRVLYIILKNEEKEEVKNDKTSNNWKNSNDEMHSHYAAFLHFRLQVVTRWKIVRNIIQNFLIYENNTSYKNSSILIAKINNSNNNNDKNNNKKGNNNDNY